MSQKKKENVGITTINVAPHSHNSMLNLPRYTLRNIDMQDDAAVDRQLETDWKLLKSLFSDDRNKNSTNKREALDKFIKSLVQEVANLCENEDNAIDSSKTLNRLKEVQQHISKINDATHAYKLLSTESNYQSIMYTIIQSIKSIPTANDKSPAVNELQQNCGYLLTAVTGKAQSKRATGGGTISLSSLHPTHTETKIILQPQPQPLPLSPLPTLPPITSKTSTNTPLASPLPLSNNTVIVHIPKSTTPPPIPHADPNLSRPQSNAHVTPPRRLVGHTPPQTKLTPPSDDRRKDSDAGSQNFVGAHAEMKADLKNLAIAKQSTAWTSKSPTNRNNNKGGNSWCPWC